MYVYVSVYIYIYIIYIYVYVSVYIYIYIYIYSTFINHRLYHLYYLLLPHTFHEVKLQQPNLLVVVCRVQHAIFYQMIRLLLRVNDCQMTIVVFAVFECPFKFVGSGIWKPVAYEDPVVLKHRIFAVWMEIFTLITNYLVDFRKGGLLLPVHSSCLLNICWRRRQLLVTVPGLHKFRAFIVCKYNGIHR